jgi:glyoxylase-like metal-dependent hydrolase (beta-lactamase superfamily II)
VPVTVTVTITVTDTDTDRDTDAGTVTRVRESDTDRDTVTVTDSVTDTDTDIDTVSTLTMLGSGSAGNNALVATDHCKILVDGGLSARQVILRLEQCGVTAEQLDGVVLTHEHTDHICGLEVLCRKFDLAIYCNRLTAEALRSGGLGDQM